MPPPSRADTPAGEVDLVALAGEVCRRYGAEFPDEAARYEPGVWDAWCLHDNQHILSWAFADVHQGIVDLAEQMAWLAGVLAARDYPAERLRRDLELAADVVREQLDDHDVAARLRLVAATLVPG